MEVVVVVEVVVLVVVAADLATRQANTLPQVQERRERRWRRRVSEMPWQPRMAAATSPPALSAALSFQGSSEGSTSSSMVSVFKS